MASELEMFLSKWNKPYIHVQDLYPLFSDHHTKRYDEVKYAIKKGFLKIIRRGLYFIDLPYRQQNVDLFELANMVFGPSYVSLESALSYHQWIPEGVKTITSVTPKRSKCFKSEIGVFNYAHIPNQNFYSNVQRVVTDNTVFYIAEPWKALADHLYVYKREWKQLNDLEQDLRIDLDVIKISDLDSLKQISKYFHNTKVRNTLKLFLQELKR